VRVSSAGAKAGDGRHRTLRTAEGPRDRPASSWPVG
jgi:hypothetical protein